MKTLPRALTKTVTLRRRSATRDKGRVVYTAGEPESVRAILTPTAWRMELNGTGAAMPERVDLAFRTLAGVSLNDWIDTGGRRYEAVSVTPFDQYNLVLCKAIASPTQSP